MRGAACRPSRSRSPSWSPPSPSPGRTTPSHNLAPVGAVRDLLGGPGAGEPAARAGLAGGQPAAAAAPRAARRRCPPRPGAGRLPALGLWPAAASLLVFLWLELVYPDRAEPTTVGGLPDRLRGRAAGAGACGSARSGSPPATASRSTPSLIARLSPWGRRDDGRLVAPQPAGQRDGAPRPTAGWPRSSSSCSGSTAFDGLSRTVFWQTGPGAANDSLSGTVGLLAMIALVGGAVRARHPAVGAAGRPAARASSPAGTRPRSSRSRSATRWRTTSACSCSTGRRPGSWPATRSALPGVDLFGTYGNVVDLTAVSADAIALVQVGAIVAGHVARRDAGARAGAALGPAGPGVRPAPAGDRHGAVHHRRSRAALRVLTAHQRGCPPRTGESPGVRLQVRRPGRRWGESPHRRHRGPLPRPSGRTAPVIAVTCRNGEHFSVDPAAHRARRDRPRHRRPPGRRHQVRRRPDLRRPAAAPSPTTARDRAGRAEAARRRRRRDRRPRGPAMRIERRARSRDGDSRDAPPTASRATTRTDR